MTFTGMHTCSHTCTFIGTRTYEGPFRACLIACLPTCDIAPRIHWSLICRLWAATALHTSLIWRPLRVVWSPLTKSTLQSFYLGCYCALLPLDSSPPFQNKVCSTVRISLSHSAPARPFQDRLSRSHVAPDQSFELSTTDHRV